MYTVNTRCIFSFLKVKYLSFYKGTFLALLLIIYAELDTWVAINFLKAQLETLQLSKSISGIKTLTEIGKYGQQ